MSRLIKKSQKKQSVSSIGLTSLFKNLTISQIQQHLLFTYTLPLSILFPPVSLTTVYLMTPFTSPYPSSSMCLSNLVIRFMSSSISYSYLLRRDRQLLLHVQSELSREGLLVLFLWVLEIHVLRTTWHGSTYDYDLLGSLNSQTFELYQIEIYTGQCFHTEEVL